MARAGEPRVLDAGAWSGVRGREAVTDRLPVRGSPWILRQPATVPATPTCGHGFRTAAPFGLRSPADPHPDPSPMGRGALHRAGDFRIPSGFGVAARPGRRGGRARRHHPLRELLAN